MEGWTKNAEPKSVQTDQPTKPTKKGSHFYLRVHAETQTNGKFGERVDFRHRVQQEVGRFESVLL